MIQIIAGEKGKGKTKHLLDRVNESVKSATGNIVYLDKNQKHMYELSNKVRLINVSDYLISNCDEFLGFLTISITYNDTINLPFVHSGKSRSFLEILSTKLTWNLLLISSNLVIT